MIRFFFFFFFYFSNYICRQLFVHTKKTIKKSSRNDDTSSLTFSPFILQHYLLHLLPAKLEGVGGWRGWG